MAFSSQSTENINPMPQLKPASEELEKAVSEAMQGISLEDLMAEAVSRPGGADGPALDPNRPVRGGRPASRQPDAAPQGGAAQSKRGRVVSIRDRSVFIDLGGKSQGMAALEQFESAPGEETAEPLEIGREYDFIYTGYDAREGLILLARKGSINHGGLELLHVGDTVEGTVEAANKGGLELRINHSKAFMPAGQVDIRFCADLSTFIGQKMRCRVMQIDPGSKRLVVSRRDLLEEDQAKLREKTWAELATGQIRQGTVQSVQAYGAFVDLGGVDGLLHVSAMSHHRVSDPNKIVKIGDVVQVMVLGIDQEKQRVSLGLKQLMKDPWSTIMEDFSVGLTVTGTVTRIVDFGAFVELTQGVEGLIHISEISTRRIMRVSDELKLGQKIEARVIAIDQDKKRIGLSMAQLQRQTTSPDPVDNSGTPETTPAGQMAGPVSAVGGAAAPNQKAVKPARKIVLKGGL